MTDHTPIIAPWGSGPSGQFTAEDHARVAGYGVGTQAIMPVGPREAYATEEDYQLDLARFEAQARGQQEFFEAEFRHQTPFDPNVAHPPTDWNSWFGVPPGALIPTSIGPSFAPAMTEQMPKPWLSETTLVPTPSRGFWFDYAARLRRDPWTFIGLGASLVARVMVPGIGWVSLVPLVGALAFELSDEASKRRV